MSKPMVVIVGRPNVGKSTLFNRLLGRPVAIVHASPGTTRDLLFADLSWKGQDFTLVDTGGLETRRPTALEEKVGAQVETAVMEADLIIFLVDGKEGVTIPDQEVAEVLRRWGKPLVLAVNKLESEARSLELPQFYQLGLSDPMPISAYHNLGIQDLMDKVVSLLPPALGEAEAEEERLKLAIVGRPNVGKSLLLNSILGRERAIVSETPGTTRDALDTPFSYEGQPLLLIDTAGLRRHSRVVQEVERYSVLRALKAIHRADVVLLVTEAPEPLVSQDAHILEYIRNVYKGAVLVVNKWDLARGQGWEEQATAQALRQRLRYMSYLPIVFASALEGLGVEQVLQTALEVHLARQHRLPTAEVNRLLGEALATNPPASVKGGRLRLYYGTQVEVGPPTFALFVNNPKLVSPAYVRSLERALRRTYPFTGTPLRLLFRSREKGGRGIG